MEMEMEMEMEMKKYSKMYDHNYLKYFTHTQSIDYF